MLDSEILRFARIAGWKFAKDDENNDEYRIFRKFAELIAEELYEECANFLLSTDLSGLKNDPALQNFIANLLANYAAAIRARGQG